MINNATRIHMKVLSAAKLVTVDKKKNNKRTKTKSVKGVM